MALLDQFARVPPSDLAVERAILGIMLLEKTAIPKIVERVTADDFYKDAHRRLYTCMLSIFQRDETVDMLTLANELRKESWLDDVGGVSTLATLADEASTSVQLPNYLKMLIEKATLRNAIRVGSDLIGAAYDATETPGDILSQAERALFKLIERSMPISAQSVSESIRETLASIEALSERGTRSIVTGIATGFPELDRYTAGWQRSDLILVAARPSVGKTAFMLNLVRTAALRERRTVLVISLEMARPQLTQRILSIETKIPGGRLRDGTLDDRDWLRLSMASDRMAEAGIYIDDSPSVTPIELRAKARKFKYEYGVDLLCVDYLQMMRVPGTKSRQEEVAEISRSLKVLARDLEIPVIALAQLSRAVESREKKEPMLSDLRESGSLEQDADVVLFLYRPGMYGYLPDQNTAELILAKQRNGPTGRIQVVFRPEFSSFESMSDRVEPAP